MADSGYSRRERNIEEARAAVASAFANVTDRWNLNDPNTQRWSKAASNLQAVLKNAYAGSLGDFARGECQPSDVLTDDLLDFLEADPMFLGSGYMKEKALSLLKQRDLADHEKTRLRNVILNVVADIRPRREIRHYGKLAAQISDAKLRGQLEALETSDDRRIALKANWTLAALDGKFTEIARTSDRMAWWRSQGFDLLKKAWISRDT